QNALASLSLFSQDTHSRRMAIDNLLSRPDSLSAEQLARATRTETDPALKAKLGILHALSVAGDQTAASAQRLQAVISLGAVNLSRARAVLNSVIDKERDTTSELSLAASDSLSRMDARQRNSALASN